MLAQPFSLAFLRGDDYSASWGINDATTKESLLNDGDEPNFHIRRSAGGAILATITTTPDGHGSAITDFDTTAGTFTLTVRSQTLEDIITALLMPTTAQLAVTFAMQVLSDGLLTTYGFGPLKILPAP